MSAGAVVAIIAFCVMVIGSFAAKMFCFLMMEEVDRRKPDLNLYSFFSSFNRRWDRGLEIWRQYRSLCPNGKLHIYELACVAVAMIGMITLIILGLMNLASTRIEWLGNCSGEQHKTLGPPVI